MEGKLEYLELYRIALTYTSDKRRAKAMVEAWLKGRLQAAMQIANS